MARPSQTTNRFALAAPLLALWAIACAVPAIVLSWAWLLVPYVAFSVLALASGIFGWERIFRRPERFRGRVWAGLGIAGVILFYVVAMYAWFIAETQERMELKASADRLTILRTAMRQYYMRHDRFPPPAIRDKDGQPLLSWRVGILPLLGQQPLFDRFKLDEPWDSPHNQALLAEMPAFFTAPHRRDLPLSSTVYQIFVGSGTPSDPAAPPVRVPGTDLPVPLIEELFLIVEAARPVPWTSPEDLRYAAAQPLPPLGSMRRYARPPMMFVPRPSRGMLAVCVESDIYWVDLDTTDEAILRRQIALTEAE